MVSTEKWKEKLINWINPQPYTKLIDVASGTGDIAKLFLNKTGEQASVTCVEPNVEMLNLGKKLNKYKNITWLNANAEEIPADSNTYDYYTISFGIRNVSNINKTLNEAFRVLKPGGRLMCLEFSKIENELLGLFYKKYSKAIPLIGKVFVGSEKPYKYLIDSIERFYDQNQLSKLMQKNGFISVIYRNLSNGIAALHSGWKA